MTIGILHLIKQKKSGNIMQGNPVTWPRQDTYYLARKSAAWVATEDIASGAGRFFVYPKSHLIDMARNGGNFDIAFHHDRYRELVKWVIREQGLICRLPAEQRRCAVLGGQNDSR